MAASEDPRDNIVHLAEIPGMHRYGPRTGNYRAIDARTRNLQDQATRLILQGFGIDPDRLAQMPPDMQRAVWGQVERALLQEAESSAEIRQRLAESWQRIVQQHEERCEAEAASRATPAILAALSGQFHAGDGVSYALALQYVNTAYQGYVYSEISAAYSGSQADRELGERIVRDVRAANEVIRRAGNRPWTTDEQQVVRRGVASIREGQDRAVTSLDEAGREIGARIGRGETPGAAIESERTRLEEGFRRHEANWRALDTMLAEADSNRPENERNGRRVDRHRGFADYLSDRVRGMYGGDVAALRRAIERAREFRNDLSELLNADITSAQQFIEHAQRALAGETLSAEESARLRQQLGQVIARSRVDAEIEAMERRLATMGGPTPTGPTPVALSPELQAILARIEAVRDGTSQENIFTITDELGTAIGAMRGRGAEFARQRAALEERLRLNPQDAQAHAELDRMLARARDRHTDAAERTDYDDPRAFFTRLSTITDQQQVTRELEAYARYQNREQRIETMATVLGAPQNRVIAEAIVPPAAGTGQVVQPQQVVAVEPERPASGQPKDAPSSALT